MKAIKTIYKLSFILALFTMMSACEDDGDKLYLSGLESSRLMATQTDVVLLQETAGELALSLAWTDNTLSVNDPKMGAPNAFTTYIQMSTKADFSSNVVESLATSLSKAYTGQELNTLTKNLGAEPEVATTFYFRLKGSIGNNIDPVYSNIVPVDITPYLVDMTKGTILDKDQNGTGRMLSSPEADGIYRGFMGVAGWANFYLKEGDGTIWGNIGVNNSAFLLSSDADNRWNFWFPGMAGCYYTEVNTVKKQWSALYIPTLTVSGDLQGEMVFDRSKMRWTLVFDAVSTSALNIKLNGAGKLYDYSTGTDDDTKAKDNPIAFAQAGDKIELAGQAGNISVSVPQAGEVTLIVDLNDSFGWTCRVVSGSDEPVGVNQFVYLLGVDDNINGSGAWTFDNYLRLYNEDDLAYAGVVNFDSKYGYGVYTEIDNRADFYKLDAGTAASGTLLAKGETNLPAPTPGLYLVNVSLKKLTYALAGVGNNIYVSGLNDVWTFDTSLGATGTVGVYQGNITITKASEFGFQIHLDTSWSHYYGGGDGKLVYAASNNNIKDDVTLPAGTYVLTVDLKNGTYTITQ